uniref:Uncharacterized protein n=1 Tax=Strigamia maritima TaxID=126957 RepID=T1JFP7_STRMM
MKNLGLIKILLERQKVTAERKLFLIAPYHTERWLRQYQINSSWFRTMIWGRRVTSAKYNEIMQHLDMREFILVIRCHVTIWLKPDKMRSLIHEATMKDYLIDDAKNKTHVILGFRDEKWIILDCGEGSYGQILRFFGTIETELIMKNLGLIKILLERQKVTAERKLFLIAPYHTERWLRQYQINSSWFRTMIWGRRVTSAKYNEIMQHLDMREFILVIRCHVTIWLKPDKMRSLIHEATMKDYLIDDAKNKTHGLIILGKIGYRNWIYPAFCFKPLGCLCIRASVQGTESTVRSRLFEGQMPIV